MSLNRARFLRTKSISTDNAMAKIYHQHIALNLGLGKVKMINHLYMPETIMEDQHYQLYWDNPIITDRPVPHNMPDIAVFFKIEKKAILLDVKIPVDDNMNRAYTEKVEKYRDLAFEMREIYGFQSVIVMPLIISVNGLVEIHLAENTKKLGLDTSIISAAHTRHNHIPQYGMIQLFGVHLGE
ncbi:hypothetical protein HHI36_019861 [Cryptolaemus montrouzieri]|uniref:TnsA endonuclease N-terminal domain-containing protein n=1 Tax=Cryptolaemus montrouzieri TaxID=559131 RepID=A0ABD2N9R3_9CUCU